MKYTLETESLPWTGSDWPTNKLKFYLLFSDHRVHEATVLELLYIYTGIYAQLGVTTEDIRMNKAGHIMSGFWTFIHA